jgi:diaminopimelate decarboxylase
MDYFQDRDGVLHAEGVSLEALADQVGTPFYCYSSATIERHYRVFAEALEGTGALIAYAIKANPNLSVVATLARLGAGADVVSLGELKRARAAGVPANRIIFSGVGKTRDEMAAALDEGIHQFNLESEGEAQALNEVALAKGAVAQVAFRINPDVDAGTHAKISTGKAENKFGVPIDRAVEAYRIAATLPGLDPLGVAVHIGSQLTQLGPLERAFTAMGELIATLRADGRDIRRADLGGGLGIPYYPDLPPPPPPADYGAMVRRVTAGWNVALSVEPGRLIVGNAGVLVTRVVTVKQGANTGFVIVDAAMNDLLRPSLYDAWHAIRAVTPRDGHMVGTVAGPVCESGDTFATERALTPMEPGDLMAILTAGAYGATMASTYNSRLLVPEVMVSGDQWSVVRPRQTYEELLGQDRLADWLGRNAAA